MKSPGAGQNQKEETVKLDPLGRWRADERRAKVWGAIVDTEQFREGIGVALLTLQSEFCYQPEGDAMLRGANKLADLLANLHELPKPSAKVIFDLPHPESGT